MSGEAILNEISRMVSLDPNRFTTLVAGENIFAKAVATILSQNTNDRNSIEAFKRLSRVTAITPEKLLNLEDSVIINAIRISGLYLQKTKTIKEFSRRVLEDLSGDLTRLTQWDLYKAREWLLSIKGIGKKTADIILLHLGFPTFPVDTHISRVTCRLGLTSSRKYDEVSSYWIGELKPDKYLMGHLLLIEFGRSICRSRYPKCGDCILRNRCKYYSSNGEDCKA